MTQGTRGKGGKVNRMNRADQLLFEELVERIKEQSGAVGLAVAIVDDTGNTKYEHFFGVRDEKAKLPLDEDTIFGLASVTKSFVALSIMQLYEKGVIDLDAPVSHYIPEFTNKNQETVKVRHFLCHAGGFFPVRRTVIREVAEAIGLSADTETELAFSEELALAGTKAVAEQLDAQTAEHGLIGRPGEYMSYCNDGFGLLSEIVRRYGGESSFAGYVNTHILAPLGMKRSSCEFIRPLKDSNTATLYKKKNGAITDGWDFYDNAFALAGAGSMKSTLSDMKRYAAMYLNYGKAPGGSRLLSMNGVRAMIRPRMEYRPESFYCYGLATKRLDDITIVEHGGSLTGVSSNLSWSYDEGVGVIVLCNTSDVPVSVIADAAMRMYRGRMPLEDRDIYRESPWSEEKKNAACGVYGSGEGDELELYRKDGGMAARMGKKEVPFLTVHQNLGLIRNRNKDAYVRLFPGEDGSIFAIGFGGRMLPRIR